MKHISHSDTNNIENSEQCKVAEYPFDDKDINGSLIAISGRYPENGFALNKICKELVYITSGKGRLGNSNGEIIDFVKRDSLLIESGEKFYWDGKFESYMVCTPAFDPDQHILLDE